MASPEQGRNSSTPSVRIVNYSREGTGGCVIRVELDNGSVFKIDADHSAVDSLQFAYDLGDSLDEDLLLSLEQASELYLCRHRALNLLARAEQCRRGLEIKLTHRGFSSPSISAALDRLEAARYLDDRRFAEFWVRSRVQRHPEGPRKLEESLMSRGVRRQIAQDVVREVLIAIGDENAEALLRRAWEKASRRPNMTDEKLMAHLFRRGFAPAQVRRLLWDKDYQ